MHVCETQACKISEIYFKENILEFGVEWAEVGKMCIFLNGKTGHISETVIDRAKVTINH